MRSPRAEAAPWAHGSYERKALRPGCEGAAAGAPLTPAKSASASQACRAFTLEGPVTFPLKFEWKRANIVLIGLGFTQVSIWAP